MDLMEMLLRARTAYLQVLEPCKDSKVFKPPNPWVQSILALVAEVYAQDKLKLNLKFEIELLFRNMGIQISDAKPSATLAAHKRQIVNNADFAQDRVVAAPVAPAATAAAAPPARWGPSGHRHPARWRRDPPSRLQDPPQMCLASPPPCRPSAPPSSRPTPPPPRSPHLVSLTSFATCTFTLQYTQYLPYSMLLVLVVWA